MEILIEELGLIIINAKKSIDKPYSEKPIIGKLEELKKLESKVEDVLGNSKLDTKYGEKK